MRRRRLLSLALLTLIAACRDTSAPPTGVAGILGPPSQLTENLETIYGPERFTRGKGKPERTSRATSTLGFEAPFVLRVSSGDANGGHRVSSASVQLDGVEVLSPQSFNQTQHEWAIVATPSESAVLTVSLASAPDSYLEISLEGKRSANTAPTWTLLSPTGTAPAARYLHSAVYDAANDRMIVFGGYDRGVNALDMNDTWVLQNASGSGGTPSWTQLTTSGTSPAARAGHTAVYDASNNRMIIFDGSLSVTPGMFNDVWVLSNANGLGGTPTWTQLSPGAGPAVRAYGSAVYDPGSNRMTIFGGNISVGNCFNEANDTWVLSNANGLGGTPAWAQLLPSGGPPTIRNFGGALYDPASNRMTVLWGRIECSNDVTDLWTLTNANGTGGTPAWSQINPSGAPTPRHGFSTVYDAASHRATIFGGQNINGTTVYNDVWVLSDAANQAGTSAWTQLSPTGTAPDARALATAVYNATLNRMIVFGGGGASGNDVWVLTHANGLP